MVIRVVDLSRYIIIRRSISRLYGKDRANVVKGSDGVVYWGGIELVLVCVWLLKEGWWSGSVGAS